MRGELFGGRAPREPLGPGTRGPALDLERVQAGLVLAELSKVEKVTATDEELAAKINQYQQQYGKTGQDFTTPEFQRDIANRLLTEKTVDLLAALNS